MSAKKSRDIPPWEDSPTFDSPLPPEPPGWSSCGTGPPVKKRRIYKAGNRASTFEAGAEKVVELWTDADSPTPIRLEGFAGVGKTGLAKLRLQY
jgi:hypothetical protein